MTSEVEAIHTSIPEDSIQAELEVKVSLKDKVAWGVSSVSDQFVTNGIQTLALPIYNLSLGLDPRLLGWGLAIPRILDAVLDPAIGNFSDNARTRWGRRRPSPSHPARPGSPSSPSLRPSRSCSASCGAKPWESALASRSHGSSRERCWWPTKVKARGLPSSRTSRRSPSRTTADSTPRVSPQCSGGAWRAP
ncbi:hypothetical protein EDM76_06485 [bacterium]|nr:MAG: hypothetical protein EDM76_06485 [bacterium]